MTSTRSRGSGFELTSSPLTGLAHSDVMMDNCQSPLDRIFASDMEESREYATGDIGVGRY